MTAGTREWRAIDRATWAVAGAALGLVVYLALALAGVGDSGEGVAGRPGAAGGAAGPRTEAGGGGATPHARKGTGPETLRGTVSDAAGHPVPGVAVSAALELGPGVTGSPPAGGAPAGASSDPTVVAITGQDGAFTLEGLEGGRHRLRVEGPAILTAEVRFVDVPGPAVRILVSRQEAVVGRVTDGGHPVEGASVQILAPGGAAPRVTKTDAGGSFSVPGLPEGHYRVWAFRGDRASPALDADRVGAGPFDPVALVLGPAARISGRVVDRATGRGVAAYVSLVADDPEQPGRALWSDASGAFSIEGVAPGTWTAGADAAGYVSAEEVRFTVDGRAPPPPIALSLERGGVVSGRVTDAGGAPVAGAVVLARPEGDGGSEVSQAELARRLGRAAAPGEAGPGGWQGGSVTATGLRFVPRGELGVVVGPLPYPPPPGAGEVRIAAPIGSSSGEGESSAHDSSAQPASAPPADPSLASRFTTDADGRYRLAGLLPGRYRVVASHPDFAEGQTSPIAVALGQDRSGVDLVLLAGLTLTGQVTDDHGAAVVGATVEVRPRPRAGRAGAVAAGSRIAVTGSDGRYSVGPLGREVAVQVTAAGFGSAERDVTAGRLGARALSREENFVLTRADGVLEGQVTDPSGLAVRGATVRVVSGAGQGAAPAVTDDAGRYRITGVPLGRYRLRVEDPHYPPAEGEARTGAESPLELGYGGGIAVQVQERSTGAPIAGALVSARGPGGATARATSDAHGAALLSPLATGRWTLTASAPGHAGARARAEVATGSRLGQVTVRDLHLELARSATLAGLVRDEHGERVDGARVRVVVRSSGRGADGPGSAAVRTDHDGRFRITDAPSGAVTIEADKGDLRGALDLEVAPGDEVVTLEVRLEAQ